MLKLEYDKKKTGVYVVTAVYKSDRGTETESEPYTITVTDNQRYMDKEEIVPNENQT